MMDTLIGVSHHIIMSPQYGISNIVAAAGAKTLLINNGLCEFGAGLNIIQTDRYTDTQRSANDATKYN